MRKQGEKKKPCFSAWSRPIGWPFSALFPLSFFLAKRRGRAQGGSGEEQSPQGEGLAFHSAPSHWLAIFLFFFRFCPFSFLLLFPFVASPTGVVAALVSRQGGPQIKGKKKSTNAVRPKAKALALFLPLCASVPAHRSLALLPLPSPLRRRAKGKIKEAGKKSTIAVRPKALPSPLPLST